MKNTAAGVLRAGWVSNERVCFQDIALVDYLFRVFCLPLLVCCGPLKYLFGMEGIVFLCVRSMENLVGVVSENPRFSVEKCLKLDLFV